MSSEYRKVRAELMIDVQKQYVEREVGKARDAKHREVENMKKIAKAWGGVGMSDCFKAWRRYTRLNMNSKVREEARLKRLKFNAREVPKATIKLARWKVLMWGKPERDVWSGELFWVHRKTGEIRWTLPTTQEYLPKNFVMPPEFEGMSDEDMDALHVRNRAFEDVEVRQCSQGVCTPLRHRAHYFSALCRSLTKTRSWGPRRRRTAVARARARKTKVLKKTATRVRMAMLRVQHQAARRRPCRLLYHLHQLPQPLDPKQAPLRLLRAKLMKMRRTRRHPPLHLRRRHHRRVGGQS